LSLIVFFIVVHADTNLRSAFPVYVRN